MADRLCSAPVSASACSAAVAVANFCCADACAAWRAWRIASACSARLAACASASRRRCASASAAAAFASASAATRVVVAALSRSVASRTSFSTCMSSRSTSLTLACFSAEDCRSSTTRCSRALPRRRPPSAPSPPPPPVPPSPPSSSPSSSCRCSLRMVCCNSRVASVPSAASPSSMLARMPICMPLSSAFNFSRLSPPICTTRL
mmetsp:Transcript_9061/g.19644  ORF Transcript_9061/g.19644 Transcript_9061/m.19644 type:complete len:205 (+) Transcript_9061:670-1284(+)